MKVDSPLKKKSQIQFFNKAKDTKFIAIGVVCAVFISAIGYLAAKQIYEQRAAETARQEAATLAALEKHEVALSSLTVAESSVSALRAEGIDVTSIEEFLKRLQEALATSNYEDVAAFHDQIVSDSAQLKEEDEILFSSYSASLINLEIKYQDYQRQGVKVATLSSDLATVSAELEAKRYSSIAPLIDRLNQTLEKLIAIKKEDDKKAAAARAAASVAAPIAAQSNGGVTYERKVVNTAKGGFTSDILTVDMGRVKVKTFTANENDCAADCPVKPLAQYVAENGGIAGINGTYFCPPDYAQCAGVKNSFNTLVFDYRTKKYLNSSQNQYSVNPLIAFYNGSAHYYTQALGYGRDTSANGVISNHPTLVHNGGVSPGDGGNRGVRCGLGFRGSTLWAACVRGATLAEAGHVFTSLGATYALNLDGGGSSALYFNGYKTGPGRLLPNAVVFTN